MAGAGHQEIEQVRLIPQGDSLRRPRQARQHGIAESHGGQILCVATQQPVTLTTQQLQRHRLADALATVLLQNKQVGKFLRIDARQFAALDQDEAAMKPSTSTRYAPQPSSCQ